MRGLYIHIPFCIAKCRYCDFYSKSGMLNKTSDYIDAVCKRLEMLAPNHVDTVYIGGGTPSIIPVSDMNRLLKHIGDLCDLKNISEFTVEANPNSVTCEFLYTLKKMGVNRISLGVQSFNEDELKMLGRLHNTSDVKKAVSCIRKAGIENLSIDLMYGLPNQEWNTFKNTLDSAIALAPEHISCYNLKLEENTPMYKDFKQGLITLPKDDLIADMYLNMAEVLSDAGYLQYEISNFAKAEYESKHNMKYWQRDEYYGVGCSASGFLNKVRYTETADIDKYIKTISKGEAPIYEEAEITHKDEMQETLFLGLRTVLGINTEQYKKQFGIDLLKEKNDLMEKLVRAGYMKKNGTNTALTVKGMFVSNSILAELL